MSDAAGGGAARRVARTRRLVRRGLSLASGLAVLLAATPAWGALRRIGARVISMYSTAASPDAGAPGERGGAASPDAGAPREPGRGTAPDAGAPGEPQSVTSNGVRASTLPSCERTTAAQLPAFFTPRVNAHVRHRGDAPTRSDT